MNPPSVTHLPALSRFLCGDMEMLTGPPPPRGAAGLVNARLCTNACSPTRDRRASEELVGPQRSPSQAFTHMAPREVPGAGHDS